MATVAAESGLACEGREIGADVAHRIVPCLMEWPDGGREGEQTLAVLWGGHLRAIVRRRDGRTVSVMRADEDR